MMPPLLHLRSPLYYFGIIISDQEVFSPFLYKWNIYRGYATLLQVDINAVELLGFEMT